MVAKEQPRCREGEPVEDDHEQRMATTNQSLFGRKLGLNQVTEEADKK